MFLSESGITPDGKMIDEAKESMEPNAYDCFITEDSLGRFSPRSILIDSEPTVIDEV